MLGLKSKKEEQVSTKPTLDNVNSPKSIEFVTKLEQARHELALMRQVPEQRRQAERIASGIRDLERILKITEAGFDPFRPPSNWYAGFLQKPRWVSSGSAYNIYSRAMPQFAIDAMKRAKDLNVFDNFTVHSPDSTAFQKIMPMPRVVDPILVGWVGQPETFGAGSAGHRWGEAQGFMIAQWDLAKDLAFSELLLAAPKEYLPKMF